MAGTPPPPGLLTITSVILCFFCKYSPIILAIASGAFFDRAVRRQTGEQQPVRSIKIDATLPFSDIDLPLIQELDLMQPFGTGNRKIVLNAKGVFNSFEKLVSLNIR